MKKGKLIIPTLTIILFFTLVITPFNTSANALDAIYFLLSRMETDIDGSTETVEYIIALAPNRSIATGGSMVISFPDDDDSNWCRTTGALTVTAVSSSAVDLTGTTWDIDAVLPNSGSALTATCAQGGGAGSADTITISNVGAVTAGITYGVKLENGTLAGIIGTDDTGGIHTTTVQIVNGSVSDASTFDIELITDDTVTVTATVEAIPTISCSISSNSVDLGSLFPGGAYSTVTNTITVSTSATTKGYYWAAYGTGDGVDAGLYKSTPTTNLLASTGSTTIDLTALNSEGFGLTVEDPDLAGSATVPTDFSDATTGTFGALDLLGIGAGARMILSQNGAQTSAEVATVTYGGKAAAAAEAGSYSENVKFICGAYY